MMSRYLSSFLIALVGLLLVIACRPTATPKPTVMPTVVSPATPITTSTSLSPAESLTTPTASPSLVPPPGRKADADVLYVRAVQAGDATWTFHVTVQHPDTGWDDYADGWDVVSSDGTVLKPDPDSPFTRLLLHPHVNEQPFTRSQNSIVIPPGVTQVRVRAHDLVDGYGGREVLLDLTVRSGPDFETDIPTSPPPTKPVTATITPTVVGDLGWRKVRGVVYAATPDPGHELAGVLVKCSQFSYVPREGSCAPYEVTTGPDGAFEFDVFVHDTDRITLSAQKSGYEPAEHYVSGFDCVGACPPVNLVLVTSTGSAQNVELVGRIRESTAADSRASRTRPALPTGPAGAVM